MNQKDYKAIAENIRIEKDSWESDYVKTGLTNLAIKLADYFEKESTKRTEKTSTHGVIHDQIVLDFDREQFLKDCNDDKEQETKRDYSNKWECKKCGVLIDNEEECNCEEEGEKEGGLQNENN